MRGVRSTNRSIVTFRRKHHWPRPPGATRFRTPGLPSHGSAYFVVRARDAAGNEDRNSREVAGVDPCL